MQEAQREVGTTSTEKNPNLGHKPQRWPLIMDDLWRLVSCPLREIESSCNQKHVASQSNWCLAQDVCDLRSQGLPRDQILLSAILSLTAAEKPLAVSKEPGVKLETAWVLVEQVRLRLLQRGPGRGQTQCICGLEFL